MASLKDVAKLANVSLMTVSRVLNDPKRVKPETLARVQEAITQLNYVPDLSAQQIRRVGTRNKTIGVLVDLLLAHRPGGIIFTTMGLREVSIPSRLLELPCVLANCENKGEPVASYIPDDEHGQYTAVQALLAAGYSRPLCLHLPVNHLATRRRRRGLDRACREASIDPDTLEHCYMQFGDEHYRDIPEMLLAHIEQGKPRFDSVICGNDRIAFMVYQTLLTQGIRIPQDIAVLGYDNLVGIGNLFLPPLSTVQLPHYEIGRLSTLHIINGDTHRDKVIVESPWLPRESI